MEVHIYDAHANKYAPCCDKDKVEKTKSGGACRNSIGLQNASQTCCRTE